LLTLADEANVTIGNHRFGLKAAIGRYNDHQLLRRNLAGRRNFQDLPLLHNPFILLFDEPGLRIEIGDVVAVLNSGDNSISLPAVFGNDSL
jgi:hypothetical protein